MNRTERMYAIVEALRAAGGRGRNAEWLAERFEVSVRTVKRDVRALQEAGSPIVGHDGRGGGYQLARTAPLSPLTFTSGEAAAIAIAIGAEPALPFRRDARSALEKILGAMTPFQRAEVDTLAHRVWMRTPAKSRGARTGIALDEALRLGVVARIDYKDANGQPTRRSIEPMAFARTGGHWYVLAWCRLRCAGRWFLLERVRGVRVTRERFVSRDLREVFGAPPEDAQPVKLT
jgi:predicted DNA-binding transcriptional regulator YafY